MMRGLLPLIGPTLGGARWTARDAHPGTLGRPVWGPRAFMCDLEMRLGVPPREPDRARRLVALRARAEEAGPEAFFARSLVADPWGTARELGRMLDAIGDAGWGPRALPDAGPRVAALAALARDLPPGEADRLAHLERHLVASAPLPYEAIELTEPLTARAAWTGRWRRILVRLADLGVPIHAPVAAPTAPSPGDLGRVQRLLAGGPTEPLTGDGSLVFIDAPTPEPLADAVAALIAATDPAHRVVILRAGDPGTLDAALVAHDLPRLGGARGGGPPLAAAWLPLVLALAREPFDAEAAVDVLLMPDGGLPQRFMHKLAYALGDVPGPGGPRWLEAFEALRAEHPELAERLGTWLTPIGETHLDTRDLATRIRHVDVTLGARARALRRGRAAAAEDADHPAAADALDATRDAFTALVRALPARGDIGMHELDELMRTFGEVVAAGLDRPEAGRLVRVDDPAALTGDADTIIWWGFHDPGRPPRPLFHADERLALGIDDPIDIAARAADHARAIPGRARARLVLAHARTSGGQPRAAHPLASELRGRLGASDALRPIHVAVADLVRSPRWGLRAAPIQPIRHAPAAPRWSGLPSIQPPDRLAVTSLERMLRCPLQYVLDGPANLRERAWGRLPSRPILLGRLAHRLVEGLVVSGRLAHADASEIEREAHALIAREATPLALPGQRAERRAAIATLGALVLRLRAFLDRRGLRLAAAERAIELPLVPGGPTTLHGRIDLVLRDASDRPRVLDLKWSTSKQRHAFTAFESFQLAAYAHAFDPPADGALFGVRDRGIVEGDGVLQTTWARVARTVPALLERLAEGVIDVPGVDGAPAIGDAHGVVDGVAVAPERICQYCKMDLLCGRAAAYRGGGDGG